MFINSSSCGMLLSFVPHLRLYGLPGVAQLTTITRLHVSVHTKTIGIGNLTHTRCTRKRNSSVGWHTKVYEMSEHVLRVLTTVRAKLFSSTNNGKGRYGRFRQYQLHFLLFHLVEITSQLYFLLLHALTASAAHSES